MHTTRMWMVNCIRINVCMQLTYQCEVDKKEKGKCSCIKECIRYEYTKVCECTYIYIHFHKQVHMHAVTAYLTVLFARAFEHINNL